MALAHAISDAVEATYRRGDLFEKRRKLMQRGRSFVVGDEPCQRKMLKLLSGETSCGRKSCGEKPFILVWMKTLFVFTMV
jgi:hypothetical protein